MNAVDSVFEFAAEVGGDVVLFLASGLAMTGEPVEWEGWEQGDGDLFFKFRRPKGEVILVNAGQVATMAAPNAGGGYGGRR